MGLWDPSQSIKELRLMNNQPGYRFVLAWFLVVMRLGIGYVAIPAAGFMALKHVVQLLR